MAIHHNKHARFPVLGGIFLLSFAGLMFEVSLSRLLAITLWHHFAFLIISCALLGYGTAGSWQLIFRKRFSAFYPALLFSTTLIPLFLVSLHFSFDPALLPLEPFHWLYLILLFVLFSLPFFFVGLTINLLLTQFPGDAFRLYGFDLVGAAGGCFGFFLIAPMCSEFYWLVVVSIIGNMGLILLSERKIHFGLSFLTAIILVLIWNSPGLPIVKMSPYKSLPQALKYPGSRIIKTQWNAVTRVDWFESPLARFAPGLSLNFIEELPKQIGITLDGDSLTAYSDWTGENSAYLMYLPGRIIYDFLPSPSNILFLDILGGQEVQSAFHHRVPKIRVQTENALLAEWLHRQKLPLNIEIEVERGRTTLARARETFDRIVVSLEGALPTGNSGMTVLQESALETSEGITQLLLHLSETGWLTIHRYLLPPPRAEFRLTVTLVEALNEMGWDPGHHLGIFRTVSTIMFIVSASPWSEIDRATFRQFCSEQGYAMIYYPGMVLTEANKENRFQKPVYAESVQKILYNRNEFISNNPFNMASVSDDRPYFYNFLRLSRISDAYHIFGNKWEALMEAGLLIHGLFLILLLIAGCLILFPLLLLRSKIRRLSEQITYFFWIGLGFMIIEIALFEKLTQFLGEPTYSFATVLGCLLVASGIGAGISHFMTFRWRIISHGALIVLLVFYALAIDPVLHQFFGSGLPIRFCVAISLTSSVGLLMGIPFPKGIVSLVVQDANEPPHTMNSTLTKDRVALAWSFNGFGSVIGASGAMLLAQYFGLASLFIWAAILYSLAYLTHRNISFT